MSGHTLLYQAPDGAWLEMRVPWREGEFIPPQDLLFPNATEPTKLRLFKLSGIDINDWMGE